MKQVQSLGQEEPLDAGIATHSSTLAWRIPWTEEPGGRLQSIGLQKVRHSWRDWACMRDTSRFIGVHKGGDSGLPRSAQFNRVKAFPSWVRERGDNRAIREMPCFRLWRQWERPQAEDCGQPLEAEKRQETESLPPQSELTEKKAVPPKPWFPRVETPVKLQICVKSLNLWSFVMAAVEN